MNKKTLKWTIGIVIAAFVLLNIFVIVQAYGCTHFKVEETSNTLTPNAVISKTDIIKMLVFGVEIPKPKTQRYPEKEYESVMISAGDGKELSAWLIRTDSISKGLIIYFHGYKDEKSTQLDYAYQTINMGYDALLIDFLGSGGSSGNITTIGYNEADDVKAAFDYAADQLGEKNIYLHGFSMGAAAIIKAQHDYDMHVKGIVVEASYGKMLDTVRVRLEKTSILSYPLAYMFAFWGGILNDMNAFTMNPEEYAKNITVPVLMTCGDKDQYIPKNETQRIFENLASNNKTLKYYSDCTHELYFKKYPDDWTENMKEFLEPV